MSSILSTIDFGAVLDGLSKLTPMQLNIGGIVIIILAILWTDDRHRKRMLDFANRSHQEMNKTRELLNQELMETCRYLEAQAKLAVESLGRERADWLELLKQTQKFHENSLRQSNAIADLLNEASRNNRESLREIKEHLEYFRLPSDVENMS